MKKAIKHRIKTDYLSFLEWGGFFLLLCWIQNKAILQTILKPSLYGSFNIQIDQVNDRMKVTVFFIVLLISSIMMFTYRLYRDYESGKKRYMFLREHQFVWFLADSIVIFLYMSICYVVLYIILKQGIISTINQYQGNITLTQFDQLYQQVIHSHPFISQIMVINLRHGVETLLWLLAISMWCHVCSIIWLLYKRKLLDFIMMWSIVVLILSFHHVTMSIISLLLCGCYCMYIQGCWHPKMMNP